jgi:hypothetical protein
VQALRAFACLLVVAYHALYQWGRSIVPGQPSIELWPNGSAGVDLFFVISGFVMLVSSGRLRARADGWRVFAMRRLERIVPLYWGLTLVKLAVVVARPGLAPATRPTPWHVVATLLFIPARDAAGVVRPILPVGWTLNFEMLFYALFAACLAARAPPLLLLPAALLPLAVAGMFARPDWPAPFWLADPLVLEFVFGVAIGAALGRVRRLSPWLAAILVGAGGAALLAMPCGPHERFAVWGGAAALMLIGAVALEDLLAARARGGRCILRDLSGASFRIAADRRGGSSGWLGRGWRAGADPCHRACGQRGGRARAACLGGRADAGLVQGEERRSFLKKRTKKLLSTALAHDPTRSEPGAPQGPKVFWFFFSKKNVFPAATRQSATAPESASRSRAAAPVPHRRTG